MAATGPAGGADVSETELFGAESESGSAAAPDAVAVTRGSGFCGSSGASHALSAVGTERRNEDDDGRHGDAELRERPRRVHAREGPYNVPARSNEAAPRGPVVLSVQRKVTVQEIIKERLTTGEIRVRKSSTVTITPYLGSPNAAKGRWCSFCLRSVGQADDEGDETDDRTPYSPTISPSD